MKEAVQRQISTPPCPPYFHDLYERSGGQKFGLSFHDFAEILQEVGGSYLAPGTSESDTAEFHQSLRVEDLALARAYRILERTADQSKQLALYRELESRKAR